MLIGRIGSRTNNLEPETSLTFLSYSFLFLYNNTVVVPYFILFHMHINKINLNINIQTVQWKTDNRLVDIYIQMIHNTIFNIAGIKKKTDKQTNQMHSRHPVTVTSRNKAFNTLCVCVCVYAFVCVCALPSQNQTTAREALISTLEQTRQDNVQQTFDLTTLLSTQEFRTNTQHMTSHST